MSSPYQYQILQSEEIRILQLLPGQENDPITGDLLPVRLSDIDPARQDTFEALSYAWGSDQKPNILLVNGHSIPITASLHDALIRLRRPDRTRSIWADGVCINQDNTAEKEQQVALMAQIYSTARHVIADLGQATQDTESTLQLIDRYWRTAICAGTKSTDYGRALDPYETATFLGLSPAQDVDMATWKDHILPPEDSAEWLPVSMIFQRSWFTRLWVVQEFILARDVAFYIGRCEINWRHLYALIVEYGHPVSFMVALASGLSGVEGGKGVENFTFMAHHRGLRELRQQGMDGRRFLGSLTLSSVFRGHLRGKWVDLLRLYRTGQCSIQRDRVFALASVASKEMGCPSEIQPDYTTNDRDWLWRMSHFLIRLDDGCDAFMHGGIGAGRTTVDCDTPSWMLNFGRSGQYGVIFDLKDIDETSRAAGTNDKFLVVPTPRQPDAITVKAYKADRLLSLISSGTHTRRADHTAMASQAVMHVFYDPYLNIRDAFRAFLQQLGKRKEVEPSTCLDRSALEGMLKAIIVNSNPSVPFIGGSAHIGSLVLGLWLCVRDQEFDGLSGWQSSFLSILQREYGFYREFYQTLFLSKGEIEARGKLLQFYMYAVASGLEAAITENGPFASMPRGSEVGDEVWVVSGCRLPAVLRKSTIRPGMHRLIGFCHVDGIMAGEALQRDGFEWQDVVLF